MLRIHHRHDINLRFVTPLKLVVFDPEHPQPPEPPGPVALVTARLDGGFAFTAKGPTMAYVLPDGMQTKLSISYVDAEGNPASVDGAIHWESANPNIVDVFTDSDDDTTHATVQAKTLGTTQVVARADADLGDGTREIITTLDVEVVAGEAVAGTITPTGAPEPIP
jgi:hypothetical protein